MDTFFIRHTRVIAIDDATRHSLITDERIFVHYPEFSEGMRNEDNNTLDPDQHDKRGRGVVRRLNQLAQAGGYVCAEYFGLKGWIVGFVEPGTTPEIVEGRWRDWDRVARLKTIKLTKVRHITEGAGAAMLSARPRQGVLSRWWKAGRSVIRLVDGLLEDMALSDLSPDQQEVVCSEFLRMNLDHGLPRLAHLVLPTGRTMRDIDILGVASDGRPLVAQVTYAPRHQVQYKLERLLPFVGTAHAVLFCDTDRVHFDQGVHIVPLGLAYDTLVASDHGQTWLRIAFGSP